MTGDWSDVLAEHRRNSGFVERRDDENPWGAEQGSPNAPYCASASCMVAYHHGVRFPPGSQYGEKGWAYCPYIVTDGERMGITEYDHASSGRPASMTPGDFALFDWDGAGVADHVETVIATYADGTFDTAGYNTGSPEGCHVPIRRDRRYLLAVVHIRSAFYTAGLALGSSPQEVDDLPLHLVIGTNSDEWWLTDWITKRYISNPDEAAEIIYSTLQMGGKIEHTGRNGPVRYAQATVDRVPRSDA